MRFSDDGFHRTLGFLSYNRFDNEHNLEQITWLRNRLAGEVRILTGLPFYLFMDVMDIDVGGNWRFDLQQAIQTAVIMVVIMTPSYFKSEHCREEYDLFLAREEELNRNDLIIPIYYVTSGLYENDQNTDNNIWVRDLQKRQYYDWRELRFEPQSSIKTLSAVQEIAIAIRQLFKKVSVCIEDETSKSIVPVVSGDIPEPGSSHFEDYIEYTYLGLARTQKNVVQTVYRDRSSPEIALDTLFDQIQRGPYRNLIASRAELYYRIRTLEYQGLLSRKAIGPKTTLVLPLSPIGRVIEERYLIPT